MKTLIQRLSGSLAFTETVAYLIEKLKFAGCEVKGEPGDCYTAFDPEDAKVCFRALHKGNGIWLCVFIDTECVQWLRPDMPGFKKG